MKRSVFIYQSPDDDLWRVRPQDSETSIGGYLTREAASAAADLAFGPGERLILDKHEMNVGPDGAAGWSAS